MAVLSREHHQQSDEERQGLVEKGRHEAAHERRVNVMYLLLGMVLGGLLTVLALRGASWASGDGSPKEENWPEWLGGLQQKKKRYPWSTVEPTRAGFLKELSAEETRLVAKFVVNNLRVEDKGTVASLKGLDFLKDNALTGTSAVELWPYPKADALNYVNGASDVEPDRYAKVTVSRGAILEPDVAEYKVGPIGGSEWTMELTATYPYAKRPIDISDASYEAVARFLLAELRELLIDSFGDPWADFIDGGSSTTTRGVVYEQPYNDISSNSSVRVTTIKYNYYVTKEELQALWQHPYPFSFRVAQPGPAESMVYDVYYCGQGPFPDAATLLTKAKRCKFRPDLERDQGSVGDWDVPGPTCGPRNTETFSAPTKSERAAADGVNGDEINWNGWSMVVTFRPSTGLAVMDLRFKGQRVAYELALAEACALYSGADSDQVFYLDSAWSMTQLSGDVRKGLDCPKTAQFLFMPQFIFGDGVDDDSGKKSRDPTQAKPFAAGCVFEHAMDESVWRHTQFNAGQAVDGVPGKSLIVRAVSTVGNYDYVTNFEFRLDGSVVSSLKFAGMMETRYFAPDQNAFETDLGEIVHQHLAAPLHAHFALFKVDLDVGGSTANSFEVTRSTSGNPLLAGGGGGSVSKFFDRWPTKYVTRELIQTERQSRFHASEGGLWRVTGSSRNTHPELFGRETENGEKFGVPVAAPGYAIWPGPTVPQALPDDHPFVKACAFTKQTIAVTRRKDSENRATSIMDLYAPAEPVASLDAFLDDDQDIVDADIVAWVNIGKEHLPRTEDVPLISSTFGAHFILLPWNLFSTHPAMDWRRDGQSRCDDVA